MTRPKPRRCKQCLEEGIETKRQAPHPGPRCASHHRSRRTQTKDTRWEAHLLKTYDLTVEEYWAIYRFQNGLCYLCRRATGTGRRKLSVDHCHRTGIIRGLICAHDNVKVLGQSRDDVAYFERCIEYLKNPPAVQVIGRRIAPIEASNLTLNDG